MSEGIEAINEAKEFVERHRKQPALVITDVPIKTLTEFKQFANSEEFTCNENGQGHFGFCLKFLMDYFLERIPDGLDELNAKIEHCLEQIEEIKLSINNNVDTQADDNTITLCNGTKIRKGEKNETK